jgi:protein-disulfide isomerase
MRFWCALAAAAIATAALSPCVAAQSADTAATLKRLDSLEATERAIQKQLDEIKALLAARPALPAGPIENLQGLEIPLANTAVKGQSGAKLVVVEYSDFQCPFCGRYARETYAPLQKEFVDTGKVRYAFKNMPLESIHPFAFKAAEGGECAREQGKFWEMHDRLFANQGALAPANLTQYAQAIGLDGGKFQSCLDGRSAAHVRDDAAEAARLGVSSTPTFFVGQLQPDGKVKVVRKIVGAQPYATFKAALQGMLLTPPAAPSK